ncbi:MAG: ATP-dependent DNA ligase [Candidatus Eiseniibacteriota bacterium]
MQLSTLVDVSAAVAATSGRKAKIALLADLLRRTEKHETAIAVSYLAGELPQGRIGLGPSAIRKAFPDAASPASSLTLHDVDAAFARIASASGKGSATEKGRLLHELFARATADEQRFLARLVFGELRQGALEGIMAEAVAEAANLPAAAVRRAMMAEGALAAVAAAALTEGASGRSRFAVRLFHPVRPMLAQPAEDVAAAMEALGEAALEYKLDGARIQAHKDGDEVRIYTRHLREVTPALPEIVACVRSLPPRRLILDGEAIAMRADGTPHPFQVTMRRFGRKLEVEKLRETLPLSPFFFDVLHVDGAALIDEPQERRASELERIVPADQRVPGRIVTSAAAAAAAFHEQAIARGHEGIMAKSRTAPYEAGSRGVGWMKIKPAHTLDLVILGAEWGSGRREGWLSNLHLGARDAQANTFVMLGKTFKGLTDEMLAWQTEQFLAREIGRDDYTVHVRPELVAEIAFADVQTSPRYPAGLALRLARVKRYRGDKTAAEADTIDTVREIWRRSHGG